MLLPLSVVGAALPLLAVAGGSQSLAHNAPLDSQQVITRGELEKAVPPLTIPSAAPTATAPATAPSPASPSPAPANDPLLNQPLIPLDQFNVHQVDVAPPAASQKTTQLHYTVQVTGLEQPDRVSGANMLSRFNQLSALREGKGDAANRIMLRARLRQDAELLQTLLQAQGWYSATVGSRIEQPSGNSAVPVTAVLEVTPGARYSFGTIRITAPSTQPPDLIRSNLPLKMGDPIVAANVLAGEAEVAVALPEHGYPFAKVGQRDILLDSDTHLGDYTLPVDTGPRARFGGFRTTGDLAFGAHHVGVVARFKRGQIYDSRMVDDLRQALIATGLFNTVSVEPERTKERAPDGTEYVTMVVDEDAAPPRVVAGSAGYETGRGFTAQASWTHENLFPPEGALSVSAIGGTSEQGASVEFRRSNAGKRDRTFTVRLDADRSRYNAYDAQTGRLAARLSYDSTPIWRKKLTWAVGAEIVGTAEKDYDFSLGKRRYRKFLIGGVTGELGIDHSDSLLDPTRGFRAKALVEPEAALSNAVRPYLRSQFDTSAYFPFAESFVLAGRARIGTTLGISRNELAPSRRFYGGGGGSVRGFGYQELGPKDPSGDPVGGLSLIEGSTELRYRFGNYGIVGFVDAGQSYVDRIPRLSDIRVGVGLGVRYYTNFGPLRLDVATPVHHRPGESRINVYISIGQAF